MKLKEIIIENILIILFGVVIFLLDWIEFKNAYNILLIFGFALLKSAYFIFSGFRRIVEVVKQDLQYYKFLLLIGVNVTLIVLSFSVDYLCLYQVDSSAFTGISASIGLGERFYNFFYFSLLIFSNLGIAEIIPQSLAAKGLLMFEAVLSFITIIFILSDFISLKESLNEYLERRKSGLQKRNL